jgi:hypothetical protein
VRSNSLDRCSHGGSLYRGMVHAKAFPRRERPNGSAPDTNWHPRHFHRLPPLLFRRRAHPLASGFARQRFWSMPPMLAVVALFTGLPTEMFSKTSKTVSVGLSSNEKSVFATSNRKDAPSASPLILHHE